MILRKDLLEGLSENQQKAVISNSKRILCLAGAGSGKSTVLTKRTAYLFRSRVSPNNIACITFTRAAGSEMKKRIMKIDFEKGEKVFCNTFHKFCIEILNKYGDRIGISPNFSIINQEARDSILYKISEEFKYKYKSKDINEIISNYEKYENESYKGKDLVDSYITYMKENNSCDIDMLQYFAYFLLREFSDIKQYYYDTYKYISVDEYQDTNNIQQCILDEIAPEYLFVVGDERQAIYGFRGACVEHILSFSSRYKDAEVINLVDNYRSTEKIVAASNNLMTYAENNISKKMISNKSGEDVIVLENDDEDDQIANLILLLTAYDDIDYKDMAIIGRTNKELDYVAKYLKKIRVPFVRNIKESISNDYLTVFSNIQDLNNSTKLYSLFKRADIITDEELSNLKIESLRSGLSLVSYIESKGEGAPKEFIKILNDIRVTNSIKEYIEKSCRLFSMNFKNIQEQIDSWILEQLQLGEKNVSINEFIKEMCLDSSKKETEDGINLLTVHGSKGLEFNTVAVIGLNEGNFPSKRADAEEERRAAYVAYTRAKEKLILSCYQNGYNYRKESVMLKRSRFIDEIK